MKTYRIHLIRHGLTAANTEGRYVGGGTDEPLCDTGIMGLEFLKSNYKYPDKVSLLHTP